MCMGGDEKSTTKVKPQPQSDFERMQLERGGMMFDPLMDLLGYGFNGNRLQYYGQGGQNPLSGGKPTSKSIQNISPQLQGQGTGFGLSGQQPFQDSQSNLAAMALGGGGGGLGLSGADAYYQSRPDVQADPYYGSSPQAAYEHYQQYGQGEGSQWTGAMPGQPQQGGAPQQQQGGGDPQTTMLLEQYKAAEAKYNDGDGSQRDRDAYIAARDQVRNYTGIDPSQPGGMDQIAAAAQPKGGQAGGDMNQPINNSGERQFQPSYAESLDSVLEQNAGNTLLQGSSGNFAGAAPDQQTGDLYTQSGNVLQQILSGNATTGDAGLDALLKESIAYLSEGQKGGGQISPELSGLVDQSYAYEQQKALQDIQKFAIESAGSKGLNITDTPIGQPLLQAGSDVVANMASKRAGSKLNERNISLNRALQQTGMGLDQRNQFGNLAFGTRQQTTGAIESNLARSQALREFSEGLRQRKIDNLMRAAQMQQQFGLGLYGPRFGASSSTQTGGGGGGGGIGQFGSFLGGAGGLAGGLSMLGGTGAAAGGAAAAGGGLAAGGAAGAGGLMTAGASALAMF
jgi:hypothetical protein